MSGAEQGASGFWVQVALVYLTRLKLRWLLAPG